MSSTLITWGVVILIVCAGIYNILNEKKKEEKKNE